jgi:transcriptional regulator with XRE-family HTH domain
MDGLEFRDLRKIAKLRQVEVAVELGVHSRTIWRWEKDGVELTKVQSEAAERLFGDLKRMDGIRKSRRKVHREAFLKGRQQQGEYEP